MERKRLKAKKLNRQRRKTKLGNIIVLTVNDNPRKYWSVLKTRLKKEGSELATNCSRLKLIASIAENTRKIEEKTGKKVVTSLNAKELDAKNSKSIGKDDDEK